MLLNIWRENIVQKKKIQVNVRQRHEGRFSILFHLIQKTKQNQFNYKTQTLCKRVLNDIVTIY